MPIYRYYRVNRERRQAQHSDGACNASTTCRSRDSISLQMQKRVLFNQDCRIRDNKKWEGRVRVREFTSPHRDTQSQVLKNGLGGNYLTRNDLSISILEKGFSLGEPKVQLSISSFFLDPECQRTRGRCLAFRVASLLLCFLGLTPTFRTMLALNVVRPG